jgi:hypothetical protein
MMTNTISSLDDLRVGVINHGPFEPEWHYDMAHHPEGYTYTVRGPSNKTAITVVPWKVAEQHWALAIKEDNKGNIKVVRKDWKEANDRDSHLQSRLASICPKKWDQPNSSLPGQYIDDPVRKDWFLNKVEFKAKAIKQVMTEEEFLA